MKKIHRESGMTLIEILIAVSILAVVSALSFKGLTQALDSKERVQSEQEFWQSLAVTFSQMEEDLRYARPRPIRTATGDKAAALMGRSPKSAIFATRPIELTRGGVLWSTGRQSDLRRVAYEWDGGTLKRLSWNELDQSPLSSPVSTTLLSDVEEMRVRFYRRDGLLANEWPEGAMLNDLPRGVEFVIKIAGRPEFQRAFAVGG